MSQEMIDHFTKSLYGGSFSVGSDEKWVGVFVSPPGAGKLPAEELGGGFEGGGGGGGGESASSIHDGFDDIFVVVEPIYQLFSRI